MAFFQFKRCVFFIALLAYGMCSFAETVVSHNISRDRFEKGDFGYELGLIILSLEKTKEEYGDYRIEPIRDDMNVARRIERKQSNYYTNFVSALPYDEYLSTEKELIYVDFPVFLGVVGYRTCFISKNIKERVNGIENLEQLKTFSHGLVKGWRDVDILRHNGFTVQTTENYINLFRMVAANRFDFFCRGVNEVLGEYNFHSEVLPKLEFDRTLAFYYPLPHFFYGHASNKALFERIKKGLVLAYKDGSIEILWNKYFGSSVSFSKLDERKLFSFKNPLLKGLDDGYSEYVYKP